MIYYVYIYLREDGSPYNVGKGQGNRWKKQHRVEVPPADRVIFPVTQTTEEWAHFMEMEFIDFYGRLDDGTGILENITDGGEGTSGRRHSEETRRKISEKAKGSKLSEETRTKIAKASEGRKHSEETKRKISKAKKGISRPTHVGEAVATANKERVWTEEMRAKLSEAGKKRGPYKKKLNQPITNQHYANLFHEQHSYDQ